MSETLRDEALLTLLRAADSAASVAHDFIYGRNDVTQKEASDAIWRIHNALRPLFEDDPEPAGREAPDHYMRAALAGSVDPRPECNGRGEVAATPGQPGDGTLPCPTCDKPVTAQDVDRTLEGAS